LREEARQHERQRTAVISAAMIQKASESMDAAHRRSRAARDALPRRLQRSCVIMGGAKKRRGSRSPLFRSAPAGYFAGAAAGAARDEPVPTHRGRLRQANGWRHRVVEELTPSCRSSSTVSDSIVIGVKCAHVAAHHSMDVRFEMLLAT